MATRDPGGPPDPRDPDVDPAHPYRARQLAPYRRDAGLQLVGHLGRGGRAAAVAPEQPDRHPGGARGQPGRHRDQDAQVVAPGDRRVGADPFELGHHIPPGTGPANPSGATTAQPVRTSADPNRKTSTAWAPGRSASSSSTEP